MSEQNDEKNPHEKQVIDMTRKETQVIRKLLKESSCPAEATAKYISYFLQEFSGPVQLPIELVMLSAIMPAISLSVMREHLRMQADEMAAVTVPDGVPADLSTEGGRTE